MVFYDFFFTVSIKWAYFTYFIFEGITGLIYLSAFSYSEDALAVQVITQKRIEFQKLPYSVMKLFFLFHSGHQFLSQFPDSFLTVSSCGMGFKNLVLL